MKPGELEQFLLLCQRHGVSSLKVGDVEVTMWPPAYQTAEQPANGRRARTDDESDEDWLFAHTDMRPPPRKTKEDEES